MKKLMKLVPAFIMLLVSAILVSTATFAWFSMNTQVTATNMAIKATADGSLLISKTDNSWSTAGTSIDFELDTALEAVAVIPTSVIPGAAASNWYTAAGTSATDGTKPAASSYTELPVSGFSTTNGAYTFTSTSNVYALHEEFYLRSPSGALTNVGLKKVDFSKIGSTHDDIEQTILVRFVFKEMVSDGHGGTIPDTDANAVYVTWAKDLNGSAVTYVTGTAHGNTSTGYALVNAGASDQTLKKNASDAVSHVIGTFKENTSYHVDTYIYINGEHTKCTSYNAALWEGAIFSFTFDVGMTYENLA